MQDERCKKKGREGGKTKRSNVPNKTLSRKQNAQTFLIKLSLSLSLSLSLCLSLSLNAGHNDEGCKKQKKKRKEKRKSRTG